jgi:hypothetical protein
MMPIKSKAIIKNEFNGVQYVIELLYTFDDDLTHRIKCKGNSEGDAQTFLDSKESQILSSKKSQDIKYAVTNNFLTGYGEASQMDVWREYIKRGYSSFDPSESLFYMSKVAQNIVDMNLTNEQIAATFDSSIEEVEAILKKWDVLTNNTDAVNNYDAMKGEM